MKTIKRSKLENVISVPMFMLFVNTIVCRIIEFGINKWVFFEIGEDLMIIIAIHFSERTIRKGD